MVLGALVLAVAAFLVFSYFRNLKIGQTLNNDKDSNISQEVYTVAKGDSLWTISEKYYGSGYEWQKIADANSITDSNQIEEGTLLSIPNVEKQEIKVSDTTTIQENVTETKTDVANLNTIDGSSYTVIKGDSLWTIAVRAYGDGYKWVQIAKANNLQNPDIIYTGTVLNLPR